MKRKVVFIVIQIVMVALALALTVTTYAWYSIQNKADVTETVVTAAPGPMTTLGPGTETEHEPYKGETGLGYDGDGKGGVDKPYTVSKTFDATFSPITDTAAVTVVIKSMKITKPTTGEVADTEDNVNAQDILDCFTYRVEIDGRTYMPGADDFIVLEENGTEHLMISEQTQANVTFTLIFLDEDSYKNYVARLYGEDNITAFAYSGYENMRAVFECVFEIGIADLTE